MRSMRIHTQAFTGALIVALSGAAVLHAQQQPQGKTADQIYKNIKVLQGLPDSQFLPSMRLFSAALGVDCEFCHIESDRSADVKGMKLMARRMITMTRDLNKGTFAGTTAVTCFTCHRGDLIPARVQALPAFERKEEAPPVLPAADQLISKYVQAIGGEAAVRKVTSRQITAHQEIPTGAGGRIPVPAQVEIYQKAPNLEVTVYTTPKFTISEGFDGNTAWAQGMNGNVNDLATPFQDRAKRSANIYEPVDMKTEFSQLKTVGTEKVNQRDAYVVLASHQDDTPERLYFDKETGLLLRKLTIVATPFGDQPGRMDFDDYRATSTGVKIPFKIHLTPASSGSALATDSTIEIDKVQENVPIDNSKFTRPAPKPKLAAAAPAER